MKAKILLSIAAPLPGLVLLVCWLWGTSTSAAEWPGFINRSAELGTDIFSFTGTRDEAYDSNENYYDGDFADFDGDGQMDRALGARYGLLKNMGMGRMTPYAGTSLVNYLFRGVSPGWGEDAFQWADVDNDGDLDILQGGNGEPFTLQINSAGRFRTKWVKTSNASALNIINIDIERDGDVDLAVAHAFCSDVLCGHGCPEEGCQGVGNWPKQFHLWVNDGGGNFTDESVARGFPVDFGTNLIVGLVAGDVDNDRDFDLMAINGIARGITLAKNDGFGNFILSLVPFAVELAPIRPIGHGFSQAMNLGDIDDDGDLDLVIALVRDSAGTSHPQTGHAIFVNDGEGNFTDQTAAGFDTTEYTGSFLNGSNGKLADLDYDGDLDFLVFDSGVSRLLQIYLNNAAGQFRYSSNLSQTMPPGSPTGGTGADTDVTDLDGNGTYDLWIGAAGTDVQILINPYLAPDGLPANLPRDLALVSADTNGVRLAWHHPAYADVAQSYRVYRSTSPGLARRHSRMIKEIGITHHQDEGFAAPITRHTTTAYLGDPDAVLFGESNLVEFTDRTAVPGVTYYYRVTHVGTENTESQPTVPLTATVPPEEGPDLVPPFMDIVRPTLEDWSVFPSIVLLYGDGGSGLDLSSLQVRFNVPLGTGQPETGGRPANSDISDLFLVKNSGCYLNTLSPQLALPTDTLVTLQASIEDQAGNAVTNQVQLFPSVAPNLPPAANISTSVTNGLAPLTMTLTATNSVDSDGKILSWEWFFTDGTSAVGPVIEKTFTSEGIQGVTLLVRDTSGAIDTEFQMVVVESFRILSADFAGPDFTMTFSSLTNRTYTVERADNLPADSWVPVAELQGTGSPLQATDSNAQGTPRFYRIRAD